VHPRQARPRLLGAVADHVCGILGQLHQIPADAPGLPRMHGYARLLMAHDAAYGTAWLGAYQAAAQAARVDKAEGEPVVAALRSWMPVGSRWTGMVGELLTALEQHRPDDGWWPRNARVLGTELTKQDAVLEAAGLRVERNPANSRQVWIERRF
jgi:hypothetical protein